MAISLGSLILKLGANLITPPPTRQWRSRMQPQKFDLFVMIVPKSHPHPLHRVESNLHRTANIRFRLEILIFHFIHRFG